MEASLRQLLAELAEAGRCHDAQEQDHSRKMLNLEPASAHLLSILVRSRRRRRLLEIGTSNGYSTIWLAWATRPFGGHVISIDREAHKLALADNALSHPQEIAAYLAAVQAQPQFEHLVLPVGKGVSLAYRQADNTDPVAEVQG